MAFYTPHIYVGRPASLWDTALGTAVPGSLQSWLLDYGADTQRATHPPRPPTLDFELLLNNTVAEPEWNERDRVHFRISIGQGPEFTLFVGALQEPTFDRLTGRTIVRCRAYGLLGFLPDEVSLAQQDNDATGDLFAELVEAAGLPAALSRADATMDRTLLSYVADDKKLLPELQRIVDSQGPPGIWYQTYDGAMFAHARGMLTDAVHVGGTADLQPLRSTSVKKNLRNLVNSVDFDVVTVAGGVITVTGSIPFDDPDSVALYGAQTLRRQPFGALAQDDVRDLARAFVSQYAFGIVERGFSLRVKEANIADVIGDGSDFSGFYVGRPVIIFDRGGTPSLGRVSRVRLSGERASLFAHIDTDSYVAEELIFIPPSLTVDLATGEDYVITIPPAVGGHAPTTYAADSALPVGATSFDAVARLLTGTAPGMAQTQTFDIKATDSTQTVIRLDGSFTYVGGDDLSGNDPRAAGTTILGDTVYAGFFDSGPPRFIFGTLARTDGSFTQIGTYDFPGNQNRDGAGLVNVDGTIFVGFTDRNDKFELYTVNLSNGNLSQVGTSFAIPEQRHGAGMAAIKSIVYVGLLDIDTNPDVFELYTLDTSNGVLTQVEAAVALPSGQWFGAGLIGTADQLYAVFSDATTDSLHLFSVNLTSVAIADLGMSATLPGDFNRGVGAFLLDTAAYALVSSNLSPEIQLYSLGATVNVALTAEFTLTLQIG